jgi:hypothetical protein
VIGVDTLNDTVRLCWKNLSASSSPYTFNMEFLVKPSLPCCVIFGKFDPRDMLPGFPPPFTGLSKCDFDDSYGLSKSRTNSWKKLPSKISSWASSSDRTKYGSRRSSFRKGKSPEPIQMTTTFENTQSHLRGAKNIRERAQDVERDPEITSAQDLDNVTDHPEINVEETPRPGEQQSLMASKFNSEGINAKQDLELVGDSSGVGIIPESGELQLLNAEETRADDRDYLTAEPDALIEASDYASEFRDQRTSTQDVGVAIYSDHGSIAELPEPLPTTSSIRETTSTAQLSELENVGSVSGPNSSELALSSPGPTILVDSTRHLIRSTAGENNSLAGSLSLSDEVTIKEHGSSLNIIPPTEVPEERSPHLGSESGPLNSPLAESEERSSCQGFETGSSKLEEIRPREIVTHVLPSGPLGYDPNIDIAISSGTTRQTLHFRNDLSSIHSPIETRLSGTTIGLRNTPYERFLWLEQKNALGNIPQPESEHDFEDSSSHREAVSRPLVRKRRKASKRKSAKPSGPKTPIDLTPAPGADEYWTYDEAANDYFHIDSDTGSRLWYEPSDTDGDYRNETLGDMTTLQY